MDCSTPGLCVHHQLQEFTQTQVHWVGDAIQPSLLCRPLLLLSSIFLRISVFSNESALHVSWRKYWSFSFSISPSNEHSGLIPFRVDWLDLLAGQGTLKSLLQHHSSEASILLHSAFFIVQLSLSISPYNFLVLGVLSIGIIWIYEFLYFELSSDLRVTTYCKNIKNGLKLR